MKKKYRILLVIVMILAAVVCLVANLINRRQNNKNEMNWKQVQVEKSEMKLTLTAAGEIGGSTSDTINFSTSKTFDGMCVENDEVVKKGQKLIRYSNGTYEKAAHDGIICLINPPKAGETATSNHYLMIERTEKLSLEITVPENQINEVKKGNKAIIVVNADTTKQYEGKITGKKAMSTTLISEKSGADSQKDPFGSESSTSYYTVSLEFENDGTLLPGMSANCTVTLKEREDVLTVPVEAVNFDKDGKAYVWKGKGKNFKKQTVEIGDSDANNVEITKGLNAGDYIRVEEQK